MNTISLSQFTTNPGATDGVVESVESSLELKLPTDYVAFMRESNGGEGSVGGDSFVMLWKLDELEAFNRDYEVADYCNGLLLFGSSGGGEAYGFNTKQTPWTVVRVPFVGMDESLIESVGESFTDFLQRLACGAIDFLMNEFRTAIGETGSKKEIFEIHPIMLGGNPTDPKNKTLLTRDQHIEAVVYWNREIKRMRSVNRQASR